MKGETQVECEHMFVRRRDGKRCVYCGKVQFGEEINDEDRDALNEYRRLAKNRFEGVFNDSLE